MKWSTIIIAIICLTIGLIVGNVIYNHPEKKQYYDKPGFKTDTVWRERFIPDTGGKKAEAIPPKIVYLYRDAPEPEIKYVPKLVHDTIRLKDTATGKTVDLYPCWYNNYLDVPKLIGARFTAKGISLDFYDTSCQMRTIVYETDYANLDYYWTGTKLKVKPAKMNTIPKTDGFWKQFHTTSFLYVTRDLLSPTYYLSADYALNYKKVGLYAQGAVGYKTDLFPMVNVGIRIKLK